MESSFLPDYILDDALHNDTQNGDNNINDYDNDENYNDDHNENNDVNHHNDNNDNDDNNYDNDNGDQTIMIFQTVSKLNSR